MVVTFQCTVGMREIDKLAPFDVYRCRTIYIDFSVPGDNGGMIGGGVSTAEQGRNASCLDACSVYTFLVY